MIINNDNVCLDIINIVPSSLLLRIVLRAIFAVFNFNSEYQDVDIEKSFVWYWSPAASLE